MTIEFDEQELKGKKADSYLANILSMDLEEVVKSVVLHQETLREILSIRPSEQAKAIESLLGSARVAGKTCYFDLNGKTRRYLNKALRTEN